MTIGTPGAIVTALIESGKKNFKLNDYLNLERESLTARPDGTTVSERRDECGKKDKIDRRPFNGADRGDFCSGMSIS